MTPPAPETPQAALERLIEKARAATTTLRDASRLGTIIEFRQRDPLVMAIHDALDAALRASEGPREPVDRLKDNIERDALRQVIFELGVAATIAASDPYAKAKKLRQQVTAIANAALKAQDSWAEGRQGTAAAQESYQSHEICLVNVARANDAALLMTRKLRPALDLVSGIGSLGFDLQHHSETDIAEAVRVLRTVNPEIFDWLAAKLATANDWPLPPSSPSRAAKP